MFFRTSTPAGQSIQEAESEQGRRVALMVLAMMAIAVLLMLAPEPAYAQAALPWEDFTKKLACTVSGAWVKWAAVIAIALGGVMFGLGELNGPFQRMMQIAGGFSIAIGAVAIAGHFFGGSPGTCS